MQLNLKRREPKANYAGSAADHFGGPSARTIGDASIGASLRLVLQSRSCGAWRQNPLPKADRHGRPLKVRDEPVEDGSVRQRLYPANCGHAAVQSATPIEATRNRPTRLDRDRK